MGAFEFTALNNKGKEQKGVLEGDNQRQIRQQLRDRDWIPVTVVEVQQKEASATKTLYAFNQGIKAADLALITRQFATLVGSGLPIEEALSAVSQQCERVRLKNMMLAVRSRVMEGHSLASALQDFPQTFSDLYRATVAAGEQSGHLDIVLERLADYTEKRHAMQQNILMSLTYPIMVVIVSIAIVTGLLSYVVPQVVGVFDDLGQELPGLTQGLISASDFVRGYGLALFAMIVATILIIRQVLKREGPKRSAHALLLRLPFISRLVKGVNAARFSRTLSILTESGVPVLEGLYIASQVISNLPIRAAVEEAARRVREGASLNQALKQSHYFPPMTIHLIASGETSGQLETMLARAADSQERDLNITLQTLINLFGPFVMIVMGGAVLLIVLAMLLPIFELNQLIS